MDSAPHRKQLKRYDVPGHVHLLTWSCYRRTALLTNNLWRHWLSEAMNGAAARQKFSCLAFVFMPEHVHLIVQPEENDYSTAEYCRDCKRTFSLRVKRSLEEHQSPLLEKLTVRVRPGITAFRFWQEGGGHDRNLVEASAICTRIEYVHQNPVRRGLCGTGDKYRWSSSRFYNDASYVHDSALPLLKRFAGG